MKTVDLKGTIVTNDDKWIYDFMDIQAVCPQDVQKVMNEAGNDDITIIINSFGGDVGAGNEIAYTIQQYKGKTTADIVGYCCSAATLAACVADRARMLPTALYMIHNVSGGSRGDYRELAHGSTVLKTATEAISNAYQLKTGMSQDDVLKLMDNETWLNSEQALDMGFVDEVISNDKAGNISLNNAVGFGTILSDNTIERVRNMCINHPELRNKGDFLIQKNKTQLEILKMKGDTI